LSSRPNMSWCRSGGRWSSASAWPAAQSQHPLQGPDHHASAPADDDVDGGRRPVSGSCSTTRPGASSTTRSGWESFAWLSNPDAALYAVAITDIWMWSPS
jgi:hypothetical protein